MTGPTSSWKALPLDELDIKIFRALQGEMAVAPWHLCKDREQPGGRLRRENTIFALPNINMGGIPGHIPVYLSYTNSKDGVKGAVDRVILLHFRGQVSLR